MKTKYITKQDDIKDCGAACISSIIKFYGGYVSLETLRGDSFTGKDGVTAYHLIETLKKYNFEATGLKFEDNVDISKESIKLPAIIHFILPNYLSHFVVLYKIDNHKQIVTIMDPAIGYRNINFKEFYKLWSKVIIVINPKGKIIKYQKPKSIIKFFLELFKSEKKFIISIILFSILLTITGVISSFYIKESLTSTSTLNITNFGLIFLIITLIKIISSYLRNYYENKLNKNIDLKVIIPFIKHIMYLPLNYLKSKYQGEILTRIRELDNIKNLFTNIFVSIFLDLLLALITLLTIAYLNINIFFSLCLILILYLTITIIYLPKIDKYLGELINNESDYNSILIENIENITSIKNQNNYNYILNKMNDKTTTKINNNYLFNKLLNHQFLFQNIIEELGLFIINTIGIYLIKNNQLTILNLLTINTLVIYFLEPFKNSLNLIPEINYIKKSFNKISEFLSIKEEFITNTKEKFINGDIMITNLSFSYNNYNYLFNKLNLVIKSGTHIMLKGNSGSGKSTLCKLIYRLYDVNNNQIKIDNKDINSYNINTLRNNISYLAQNEKLFSGTILDNILFGEEPNDKVYEIIKLCKVDLIYQDKPLKEYTMINDGSDFSGGEIARIVLARCLYRNTKIIILDEALAEVEEKMEVSIIKNIDKCFSNKTIIYVTHRHHDNLFKNIIDLNKEKKMEV